MAARSDAPGRKVDLGFSRAGGEAARAGQPVQDSETFRTPEGTHAYKIVALPLSDQQTRVDHVLCHLTRA